MALNWVSVDSSEFIHLLPDLVLCRRVFKSYPTLMCTTGHPILSVNEIPFPRKESAQN